MNNNFSKNYESSSTAVSSTCSSNNSIGNTNSHAAPYEEQSMDANCCQLVFQSHEEVLELPLLENWSEISSGSVRIKDQELPESLFEAQTIAIADDRTEDIHIQNHLISDSTTLQVDLQLQIGLPSNHDQNMTSIITESNHYKSSDFTNNDTNIPAMTTVDLLQYSSQNHMVKEPSHGQGQDSDHEYSLNLTPGGYWIPTLNEIMTGASRYSCPVCGRHFSRFNNFKMHMWVHRSDRKTDEKMKNTMKNGVDSNELYDNGSNAIELINSNDNINNYNVLLKLPCFCCAPGCRHHVSHPRPKPMRDLRTLQSHFLRQHEHVRPYVCSKCGKGLAVRGDWRTHEKNCGKRWFCTCGSVFKHKRSLKEHVSSCGPPCIAIAIANIVIIITLQLIILMQKKEKKITNIVN